MTIDERELLEMALAGYAMKREQIEREQDRVRFLLRVISENPPDQAKREQSRKGGRG